MHLLRWIRSLHSQVVAFAAVGIVAVAAIVVVVDCLWVEL